MGIGTQYRKRRTPVESLLPKVIYMHYLDNTEGIPGNRPYIKYTTNKTNPFGRPGVGGEGDYSAEYRWGYIRLVREGIQPTNKNERLSHADR